MNGHLSFDRYICPLGYAVSQISEIKTWNPAFLSGAPHGPTELFFSSRMSFVSKGLVEMLREKLESEQY